MSYIKTILLGWPSNNCNQCPDPAPDKLGDLYSEHLLWNTQEAIQAIQDAEIAKNYKRFLEEQFDQENNPKD